MGFPSWLATLSAVTSASIKAKLIVTGAGRDRAHLIARNALAGSWPLTPPPKSFRSTVVLEARVRLGWEASSGAWIWGRVCLALSHDALLPPSLPLSPPPLSLGLAWVAAAGRRGCGAGH